jgi:two-component system, cell cycle response regulator DivK
VKESRFAMPVILVVDDNAVSRELLRYVLKPLGCEIVEAASGLEALERIAEVRPDVVLLDLDMPGLDGYGVLREVRRKPEWAALRVVAVTAYAMQSDRDKAIAAGFDSYVTKPINAVQIRRFVEDLLRT